MPNTVFECLELVLTTQKYTLLSKNNQSYYFPDKETHTFTHTTHTQSLTYQCILLKVFGGYNIYNIFSCHDVIRTKTIEYNMQFNSAILKLLMNISTYKLKKKKYTNQNLTVLQ